MHVVDYDPGRRVVLHTTQWTIQAPAGFEPATPGTERPQTHALHRMVAGIDTPYMTLLLILMCKNTVLFRWNDLTFFWERERERDWPCIAT